MNDARCSECGLMFPQDELIPKETTGERVCTDCSGLLTNEDLSCHYDETG